MHAFNRNWHKTTTTKSQHNQKCLYTVQTKNNQNLSPKKTSLKGFSASKCDVENWIFSKLGTFWEICLKFFWIFSGFWGEFFGFFLDFFWMNFLGNLRRIFLWGCLIFLGGFFGEDFFRRIFWEDFFGRNSLFILLKSASLFESERDWCFCQDFVSIKKEEEGKNLDP